MKRNMGMIVAGAWLLILGFGTSAPASDWYDWRGPWQRGVSPEKDLPDSWSPDPKAANNNLVWKAPIGSRSTPLVMNGRVFLINYTGEKETIQERVMCLNADTGAVIWQHKFNVFHTDIVTVRLGWTNLAGDPKTGNIYAHGTQGLFFCFDKDGKILWQRSLTEEFGRISGYGGRVTSPIVAEDLVVLGMLNSSWGDMGKGANRFLAMNKLTGEVVWWADPAGPVKDTYYSNPVVAVINGEALVISGSAEGSIYAMKLRTGEKVWGYRFGSTFTAINCAPVVEGNYVYIGHGEENPDNSNKGRVICLDASKIKDGKPELVWKRDNIKARYASAIIEQGKLYVPDDTGRLYCLDAKTGKQFWKYQYGRSSRGSPVLADGKIYVGEVASNFYILKPGEKSCELLHKQFFPGEFDVEINGSPAVANGRVYFATSDEFYCIGKPGAKPAPEPAPLVLPTKASDKIAHLQLLPFDVAVHPGDTVNYRVRAFDEHGNFIKEVKADKWLLPVPPPAKGAKAAPPALDGEIADGKLTVGKTKPAQQGYVEAEFGKWTAKARVRVAPRIPYQQDFSKVPDGAVPGGWVNTGGKFYVRTLSDGNKVLAKVNTNASPLVARGNAYIGMPNLTDYTIECDVLGSQKEGDMPDVGVGANRYTLYLAGNIQKLRIVSWDALPRIDKTIPFTWKPRTWYRLKLTVAVDGAKKAVARGKAWKYGQPEPKEWTIEVSDPRPNTEGSPTLYGYVTGILEGHAGTDIFYDNLRISPNKK